jgi:uncharacterized protein (DUF433 family)
MGAQAATVSLTEALATQAPDGALLHVRCVVERMEGDQIRLVDGSEAVLELPIEPDKVAEARARVDCDVVASVLLRVDGRRRVMQLQSPSEFVLWWHTRGVGVTVDKMLEEHELTFRSLQGELPGEGIEKTPGVVGGSARIAGTRIPVRTLESCRRSGWDEPKMLEAFPSLTPADLTHAWAYVAANGEEIEAEMAEDVEA